MEKASELESEEVNRPKHYVVIVVVAAATTSFCLAVSPKC